MKRNETLQLLNECTEVLKVSKKVKLNYFIQKNVDILEKEKQILVKLVETPEKIKEFQKKRNEVCEQFCTKDKDGKPLIIDDKYQGLIGNEDWNCAIKELEKEFETPIKEYELKLKEYEELMQDEITLELIKFSIDLIPDDIITGDKTMLIFKHLIQE